MTGVQTCALPILRIGISKRKKHCKFFGTGFIVAYFEIQPGQKQHYRIVAVDHFEVVGNGEVVASLPLEAGGTAGLARQEIEVDRSGWYLLRAWNSRAAHPVLDSLPFATTSPIYVTLGDEPVRSAGDADYFVAWIDRLVQAADTHAGYNTAQEKAAVLERLGAARAVFDAQRSGSR